MERDTQNACLYIFVQGIFSSFNQDGIEFYLLVALNTFGKCQRPFFSLGGVSQHMHKITSLWTQLVIKLQENDERKTPLLYKIVCFQIGKKKDSGQQSFITLVRKLHLSQKLRYFRVSRFSQCFILSVALRCSLPRRFYANIYFELLPNVYSAFNRQRCPPRNVKTHFV